MRHDDTMTTSHIAATVPLPPPVARPQDAQLRQDVRWLAATLGRVVGRWRVKTHSAPWRSCAGLPRQTARRPGGTGPGHATRADPIPASGDGAAHGPGLYGVLHSHQRRGTAHRVRRSRQDDLAAAQRGSVRWSLHRLREAGQGADEVTRALLTLDVRPSSRRIPPSPPGGTILDLQARLAEGLLARDGVPEPQRRAIEGRLEARWSSSGSPRKYGATARRSRTRCSNALWYLETASWRAASRVRERPGPGVRGRVRPRARRVTPLTMGSWVGGGPGRQPVRPPRESRSPPRAAPAARCSATTPGRWLTSRRGSPYPSGSRRSRPSCGPRSSGIARPAGRVGAESAAATPTSPFV